MTDEINSRIMSLEGLTPDRLRIIILEQDNRIKEFISERADFDIRTMEATSNYYGLRSAYYMLRRCGIVLLLIPVLFSIYRWIDAFLYTIDAVQMLLICSVTLFIAIWFWLDKKFNPDSRE